MLSLFEGSQKIIEGFLRIFLKTPMDKSSRYSEESCNPEGFSHDWIRWERDITGVLPVEIH